MEVEETWGVGRVVSGGLVGVEGEEGGGGGKGGGDERPIPMQG